MTGKCVRDRAVETHAPPTCHGPARPGHPICGSSYLFEHLNLDCVQLVQDLERVAMLDLLAGSNWPRAHRSLDAGECFALGHAGVVAEMARDRECFSPEGGMESWKRFLRSAILPGSRSTDRMSPAARNCQTNPTPLLRPALVGNDQTNPTARRRPGPAEGIPNEPNGARQPRAAQNAERTQQVIE
jgi:hypothetical protein